MVIGVWGGCPRVGRVVGTTAESQAEVDKIDLVSQSAGLITC